MFGHALKLRFWPIERRNTANFVDSPCIFGSSPFMLPPKFESLGRDRHALY